MDIDYRSYVYMFVVSLVWVFGLYCMCTFTLLSKLLLHIVRYSNKNICRFPNERGIGTIFLPWGVSLYHFQPLEQASHGVQCVHNTEQMETVMIYF